jgi:hypothetical protein
MSDSVKRPSGLSRLPRPRATGVIAMAAAAAFIAWLALKNDGDSPSRPAATTSASATEAPQAAFGPVAMTVEEFRSLVTTYGQPLFWAGAQTGRRLEVTRTNSGNVFVRYLPSNAEIGDSRRFLTIGTYPVADAYATTRKLAAEAGAIARRLEGGGLAYYRRDNPVSVYVVYPGLEYQIEVYDPDAARARSLVETGQIRQVG